METSNSEIVVCRRAKFGVYWKIVYFRSSMNLRFLLSLLLLISSAFVLAQDQEPPRPDSLVGVPVVLGSDTMFNVYGEIGPFSAVERAQAIQERLSELSRSSGFNPSRFSAAVRGDFADISYGDTTIMTVTVIDAAGRGLSVDQTANEYVSVLRSSTEAFSAEIDIIYILKIVGSLVLVIIVIWVLIWLINRAYRHLVVRTVSTILTKDRLHLHKYKLITVDRQRQLIITFLKAIKLLFILFIIYLALPVIFSVVPLAEGVANNLIDHFTYPLKTGFWAFVGYVPKLIAIIIIVYVVRSILRLMRSLAREVENGKVDLKGFYPDWAMPTFNLLRFVIFIFTFVLIFPLLPGSQSAVFQGVSVFLGLLISLGSQSAISNIISGLVITYMRAFNIGDRVRIGETSGDVIERSLLVTKVRTIKNEDVTIPNSNILNSHTVNYTTAQSEEGLILHTTVTIGYDVPWRKVKALLIEAALHTGFVEETPRPFVLQTSLDDFYVSYQLNCYTKRADKGAVIYSELHANIQDIFAREDVEIMSPHYRVNREMLDTTIPDVGQMTDDAGERQSDED